MKLNMQTLQWQQQSSQTLKNHSEDKSFLENTYVNQNFKVYLVEAHWINEVRKYIAQVCQIYNVPQTNDEIPKKSKGKSKAKKVVSEVVIVDNAQQQQKNLVQMSTQFM